MIFLSVAHLSGLGVLGLLPFITKVRYSTMYEIVVHRLVLGASGLLLFFINVRHTFTLRSEFSIVYIFFPHFFLKQKHNISLDNHQQFIKVTKLCLHFKGSIWETCNLKQHPMINLGSCRLLS